MSKYYEITLSARHLWIILSTAMGLVFISFLLGLWVGSFGVETSVEALESEPVVEEIVGDGCVEPVDLSEAEPPVFEDIPETEKPSDSGVDVKSPPKSAAKKPAAEPSTAASSADARPDPSSDGGRWTVQVMAISNAARSQTWLQKLLASGYDAFMETLIYPQKKHLYRIRVGRFQTREQADIVQRKLAKEPFIVKEKITPWVTRL